jgi:hypothetical protein
VARATHAAPAVDFFIAGVQKGGTNALYRLLYAHPHVRMSRVKEPHFFDDDELDWSAPDFSAYHAFFDPVDDGIAMVGEATPILTYWPSALERIANYNPRARLVICLRHPAFRAHSHWRQERERRLEELPFDEAIGERGRDRVRRAPGGVHRVYSYVERGFYGAQVARLQKLFPPRQLLFVRTDRLWSEPGSVLGEVLSFLGLSPGGEEPPREYVVWLDSRAHGPMRRRDREYLDSLYADDVRLTAHLSSLALDDWLDPAYEEPLGLSVGDSV